MTDITPSDTQYRAIAAIKAWYANDAERQQVFRLFGYAGTGKSTVLKFALDELGLEPHEPEEEGKRCVPGVVTATKPPRRRSKAHRPKLADCLASTAPPPRQRSRPCARRLPT